MELHHGMCPIRDPLKPDTDEWGNGDIDDPDVELDRLQRECL